MFISKYLSRFINLIIIDKSYNYAILNNICLINLAKLNGNRLIIAKFKNKQKSKKPKIDIDKTNN